MTQPLEELVALDRFRGLPASVASRYEERAGAIRAAFAAGASITTIARRLGVGRQVVYDVLRGTSPTKGEA